VVQALASMSVKLQGSERVKGSRSGECSKRVADLVGDRIEEVGGCRAMEEEDDRQGVKGALSKNV
jgi:hypothetical protein